MPTDLTPPSEPEKVEPVLVVTPALNGTTGGTTAENYISKELQKARASLRMTQIASVLICALLSIYVVSLTSKFKSQLEPTVAAEIADGMIMQQINDNGPELTKQLQQKIPEFIEKTPDIAMEQLPKYRESLAQRVETDLNKYCQDNADKLGMQLDTYLDSHKDEVKGLLTSGNDPVQVKAVGDSLKQILMKYITEKSAGGESIGDQISKSLTSLQEVEKKVHRLATAKDLQPQEKKARHAIAVLTHGIAAHTELQIMH